MLTGKIKKTLTWAKKVLREYAKKTGMIVPKGKAGLSAYEAAQKIKKRKKTQKELIDEIMRK